MRKHTVVKMHRRAAVVAALVGLLGAALSRLPGILEIEETTGLATLFALRGAAPPPGEVVVVSVSRESASALGLSSDLEEWPRALHGELIDALHAAGAAAVVFDVIFDKPRGPAGDLGLAEAIRQAGNVILAERVDEPDESPLGAVEQRTLPRPEFAAGALATAPFTLPVVPIRVAQFWPFGRMSGDLPSLPAAALQAHLLLLYDPLRELLMLLRPHAVSALPMSGDQIAAAGELQLGMQALRGLFRTDRRLGAELRTAIERTQFPPEQRAGLLALVDMYAGAESRYINFYGPAGSIETVRYDRALRRASEQNFAGKTVFVGFAERRQPEQQDDFYSVFSQRSGLNLSGVEIGATAFANLLERASIRPLSIPAHLLLVLLWGAALGAILAHLAPARAAGIAAVAAAGYGAAAYFLFLREHQWLPVVVPIAVQAPIALASVVYLRYRDLVAQRERIQTALGYYVPPAVVQRLAHETIEASADRQLVFGTCLFTDAERYTALSEALPPERLAALMNDYYEVMFAAVKRHDGLVSDTAGDAMVAVWATARPESSARERACRAALEIKEAVAAFNRAHASRPLPTRVGLESGPLVLGNIGAGQRFEYRAIGDIVNTAARIQDLNRVLGTDVLASGTTVAGRAARARPLGAFLLRGKSVPVEIYELLTEEPGAEATELFVRGLAAVRGGEWARARPVFDRLLEIAPSDGPGRFYARLAADYDRQPPERWTGAVEIKAR